MTGATVRRAQGTPCWVSLTVRDLPTARAFYGGLFGWEFRPGPDHFGPYVRAESDGRPVAGLGEGPAHPLRPARWTTYLAADDADATAGAVRGRGGTVAVGPLDAEDGSGRMAIAADPSGAAFGIWQSRGRAGFEVTGAPGGPARSELVTRDAAAVAGFYAAVFGSRATPVDGGAGSPWVLRVDGVPVAGVLGPGGAADGDGARWRTCFEVADPDAAARRAVALGGRVLAAPHEAGHGRVVEVADPEGADFRMVRTVR